MIHPRGDYPVLLSSGKRVPQMRGNSMWKLIGRFVSYKKDNGYQYQTGVYYLERYALFVTGTMDLRSTTESIEPAHMLL